MRDGQQTPGVDFSLDDKLLVMQMLDKLGVDYIEGGYAGGNPTDNALFAETRPSKATFTAFGMTKRAGRSAANDPGFQAILQAKAKGRLLCRQILGLSCPRGAGLQQRRKSRIDPR